MKIASIETYKRSLALKKPYTIARDTFYDTENVFFEIYLANGMIGLGAACPEGAVVGETAEITINNLESDLVQALVGKDIRGFSGHISAIAEVYGKFPGTMAAIDIALHDAFGQWLDIPIVDFYGRKHRQMLTSITIGIKNVPDTIEEAKEYYSQGFKALKVKTGLHPEEDAERILKLREIFKDHFSLRVDVNTGYDLRQLSLFLKLTKDARVEVIEQPFLPGKEKNLLHFPRKLRKIFTADESLTSPATAMSLAKDMPYGIFNIKLMKCGGIRPALQIAGIAQHASVDLFWGCNDESRISIAAALHAALSCSHTKFLDLDGSFDLAEDLAEGGFILKDGYLMTNHKSGLGLTKL